MKKSVSVLRSLSVLTFLALLTIATGCANWNTNNDPTPQAFGLTKSRMSARSVGIEIAVAQVDASQTAQLQELLATLDQQKLPLETRQQLDRNGLTCGIMSTRAPAVFHDLLEPFTPDPDSVDIAARPLALAGKLDPISRLLIHQRISNADGEVYPVGTSDQYADLAWIVHQASQHLPGEAHAARCFFDITTFPNSDGSAKLKLMPVIRHGKEVSRIEVAEGSFVMDRGQRRKQLEPVSFEIQLRAGQTLIVAATQPFADRAKENSTLGPLLLGSDRSDETRLLLVRLVQTQMDDLFDRSLR